MRRIAKAAVLFSVSLLLLQCSSSKDTRSPSGLVLDSSGYAYDPADRSCDGFPRLHVETMPGTCLGLVLSQKKAVSSEKPWKMPRTILSVPGTQDFLVSDMGGWAQNKGAIYLLKKTSNGSYENVLLKNGLNMPHALRLGPDGLVYVGETDKISRFRLLDGKITGWEVVVSPLLKFKGYMHPLVQLAFDPRNGDLYINAGSPSDRCIVKDHGSYQDCPEDAESGLGAIYRVPGAKLRKLPPGGVKQYEVSAQGLRNSMAMVVHPSGWLLQGENGRDFPELEEPYEELNAINLADDKRGMHFGWPYCNDFHAVSPEWRFEENRNDPLRRRFQAPVNCANRQASGPGEYQPPHILFPPHVAPLHFDYYPATGQLAPLLKGQLLVSWHGYQPPGHRLVSYPVDERGLPVTQPVAGNETYKFNVKGGCPVQRAFKPQGGLDRFARHNEVISGWNDVKGTRPKGAPVGFAVAEDGSVFVVEDKNRVIVRLARSDRAIDAGCSGGTTAPGGPSIDPRVELLAWRAQVEKFPASKAAYEKVRDGVLRKYCASCHGGFAEKDIAKDGYSELDYLMKNDHFIVPGDAAASKVFQSLAKTGEVPAMPPKDIAYPEHENGRHLADLKAWIEMLPADLIKNGVRKTAMKESRKVRSGPGVSFKECGAMGPGDVVYIDPRASAQVKRDGWLWAPVFVIPGDSRLFKGACPFPSDGVHWMATTRL